MPKKSTGKKTAAKAAPKKEAAPAANAPKHNCAVANCYREITCSGKRSLAAMAVHIVAMLFFNCVAAMGVKGGTTPLALASLPLTIPLVVAGFAGVAAFGFGLCAIVQKKERSVFVILSTVYGFLILLFAVGELFSNH